ncbi:MAG: hypothetical protein U1A78_19595 [Polyangia bacterium]
MNPTLLLTAGEFGQRVAARLMAESLPALVCLRSIGARPEVAALDALFAELGQALKSLLRHSAAHKTEESSGSRLDLVLVADVGELGAAGLVELAQRLSELLAREFAVLFPPGLPPEQRGASLVVLLSTPAFDSSPGARAALAALQALVAWHLDGPPSPILSRVYTLPQQTEAMPLSVEDRERAAAQFVLLCYASGLRDTDAIRARLGPPRQPGALVSSLAIAAADVDVGALVRALGWRSALSGLSTLVEHCDRSAPRERAVALADNLSLGAWSQPLVALEHHPDAAASGTAHARWLQALDRAEADALQAVRADLDRLLAEHLTGSDGLRGLQLLRSSLAELTERLRAAEAAMSAALAPQLQPEAQTQAAPAVQAAPMVQAAPAAVPNASRAVEVARALGQAALLGACVGALVLLVLTAALSRSMAATPAAGPVVSGPVPVDLGPVWAGIFGGLAVAAAGAALLWPRRRPPLDADADAPTDRDEDARRERVQRSQRAAEDLKVRRLRIARAAHKTAAALAERLEVLQGTVLDAREQAREELRRLGVKAAAVPAEDDYSELLEKEAPLHRALLRPEALPGLWERSQALRDPEIWASELLKRAWQPRWLTENLPFEPGAAWEAELWAQHRLLRERGAFSWPEVEAALVEPLRGFLAGVPRALAFGVRGREPDGTPTPLREAHQTLLIVPSDGRGLIERLLRDQPLAGAVLLSGSATSSRVLLLRTTGELTVDCLERSRP